MGFFDDLKKKVESVVGGEQDYLGQAKNNIVNPGEDFLKNIYSRNGNEWGVLDPWVGLSRMAQEAWNEYGPGKVNKNREKEYQNKVVSEEQAARQKLIDDENKRRGLLDEMASLAAAGGRRGRFGSQFKGMFADETDTDKDLLGL